MKADGTRGAASFFIRAHVAAGKLGGIGRAFSVTEGPAGARDFDGLEATLPECWQNLCHLPLWCFTVTLDP